MTQEETLGELEATRLELRESLARQAAITEILRVIAAFPTEIQPVLDTIVEAARRFCAAEDALVALPDGGAIRLAAHSGPIPVAPGFSYPLDRGSMVGRSFMDGATIESSNVQTEDVEFPRGAEHARSVGYHAAIVAPLLREGKAIGTIALRRLERRPFTERQVELLRTFADQAVIAIENVRLFNETKESLERQTALSDVLSVIASSPNDVQRVLDVIAERAALVCGATDAHVYRLDGNVLRQWAHYGPIPGLEPGETLPLDRSSVIGRAIVDRLTIHIRDTATEITPDSYPTSARLVERWGYRTGLSVPLLAEGVAIGGIAIRRMEQAPFSERQVELLQTFASQAVIAIENARLYETIERQRTELRRFLSPQVAELVTTPEGEAMLRGHRREITVVFCDLRGFTAFSETAEPEEALAVVRTYHGALGPLIFEHGGTLEHFEGDGAMVFFNDPVAIDQPVLKAIRMTVSMRERMDDHCAKWRKLGYELGFGCGLATGYATLGRIGFEGRYDYGAIGPVTNLAARLGSEAKAGQILISQRAYAQVEDQVEVEPIGELTVKGYSRPQVAYNVVRLKEVVPV